MKIYTHYFIFLLPFSLYSYFAFLVILVIVKIYLMVKAFLNECKSHGSQKNILDINVNIFYYYFGVTYPWHAKSHP